MKRSPRELEVFRLAEGYGESADGKRLWIWPYTIDFAPDNGSGVWYLGEGDGKFGGGSFLHAAQILQPPWLLHLERAEALWLLPILQRMARGEDVSSEEVTREYKRVHGKQPKRSVWDVR